MRELIEPMVRGHVKITDVETGEVLMNKSNAIHYENFSIATARSLANLSNGPIYQMSFGNGGSTVNGLGIVTYLPPNVQGQNADLYNTTYTKVVDATQTNSTDTYMSVVHQTNALFTDIVITCLLGFGEPTGQNAFDDATNTNSDYMFDEIGLKTQADNNEAILLSHVIFNTIQKSLNRSLKIQYTIRIQMA
jgi:hypothetical protein